MSNQFFVDCCCLLSRINFSENFCHNGKAFLGLVQIIRIIDSNTLLLVRIILSYSSEGKGAGNEMGKINRSGRKMLMLVENILDIQKFENAKVELKTQILVPISQNSRISKIIYD